MGEEASKRFFALFFKLLSSLTLSKTREEFAKKQKNCFFFFFRPVLQKLDGLRLWPARHRPMLYARQQDSPMAHMISSSTANEGVGNTVFENQRKCLIFFLFCENSKLNFTILQKFKFKIDYFA